MLRWAIVLVISTASAGFAAEDELWSQSGEWEIHIAADDRGCYAARVIPDGSRVEIGFDLTQSGGYFAIYNPAWTNIKEDQVGFIEFDFGDERFGGDAVGRYQDGVPGGYAFFDNPAFADKFANGLDVKVIGSRGATFNMDLTGTKRAVAGVRECQAAQPAASD